MPSEPCPAGAATTAGRIRGRPFAELDDLEELEGIEEEPPDGVWVAMGLA